MKKQELINKCIEYNIKNYENKTNKELIDLLNTNECYIQNTGKNRNIIDKFYTNEDIVNKCYLLVYDNLKIDKNDIIIEPSAGNGAFIKIIQKLCDNYLFYDLYPEHSDISKQDFLKLDLSFLEKYKNIHFIGNPPFGKQSSLALKFIKHLSKVASSFSFILPKSFKKDSYKNKIPLNFHLINECELPTNSFNINEKIYDVPCIFQIWEKKTYNRHIEDKLTPYKFVFVTKDKNPDISFRRVGAVAGKIDINTDKSIQSHYFIKFDKSVNKDIIIPLLQKIKFLDNVSANEYPSISKQQLIKEFNSILT